MKMNEFDEELDNALRLMDDDAWFLKEPKYVQAKERIKQAIEKHVIGEDDDRPFAERTIENQLREKQRQILHLK
jgi:hypothetical protein